MLKVLKFGGSSMADEKQFAKVRDIVRADDSRRVVVVSAAGKRDKNDHKITDLLYLCHAHLQYGVSCDGIYDMIRSRYVAIRDALGLKTPLEAEFAALREKMDKGISADELVSRGEYFAAELMADYLGFDFLDSSLWLKFKLDARSTRRPALRTCAAPRRAGGWSFRDSTGPCPTAASTRFPAAAATSPAHWPRRRWTPTCTRTGRTCPAS